MSSCPVCLWHSPSPCFGLSAPILQDRQPTTPNSGGDKLHQLSKQLSTHQTPLLGILHCSVSLILINANQAKSHSHLYLTRAITINPSGWPKQSVSVFLVLANANTGHQISTINTSATCPVLADATLTTTLLSTYKNLYFAFLTFTKSNCRQLSEDPIWFFTFWRRRKRVLIAPPTPPCANCAGGQEESQTAPPNLMKRRCSLHC